MIAFAANSVLCRLALGDNTIDAASFTIIRLVSGAFTLMLILAISNKAARTNSTPSKGSWLAGLMLFLYAVTFSYAYISLDTGTGALILFGSVQITMIIVTLITGTRLHLTEWLGVTIAFGGFVYLMLPGAMMPSLSGFILMTTAGIAWGFYSLKGRGSSNPLSDTTFNFIRTIPFIIITAIIAFTYLQLSPFGITMAVLSGALASGVGYTIWYIALGGLSRTQAAVVQLSVPVIAAMGGIVFASEMLTKRLILSSVLILSGILMVVLGRYYFVQAKTSN